MAGSRVVYPPGSGGGGSGTPSAPDTSVQFNDGGAFGGDSSLVWDKTANYLTLTGTAQITVPNDGTAAIVFQNANAPTETPQIFLDNDGTWHLFSDGFGAALDLNIDDTWAFTGEFVQPINYSASGGPPVVSRIAQLRGVDFFTANDDGPGTGDSSPPRFAIFNSKPATASSTVASISLALSGAFWNGTTSIQKGIELGNVIRTTGNPELWFQQLSGGVGNPWMRTFWDQSVTGIIATHDQNTYKLALQAYDVDGAAYKSFIVLTAGNTPDCTIAPPTGGTVTVQATTYKSSDGTDGITGSGSTVTTKNGLVTGLTSGGGLTTSIYSTDANLAAAVNTLYVADISGFSADRTLTLPGTAAVDDRVGLCLSVGDTAFEFLITATSGDTLNGVAGGTEWSRLFIKNEIVIMRCTVANTTWIVEHDGRIPQFCWLSLTTAADGETAATVTLPTAAATPGAWTVEVDNASIQGASTSRITPRRTGVYDVTMMGNPKDAIAANKYWQITLRIDGTAVLNDNRYVTETTTNATAKINVPVNLTVGSFIECAYASQDGGVGFNLTTGHYARAFWVEERLGIAPA